MANTAVILALICVSFIGTLVIIGLVAAGTLAIIFLDSSSDTSVISSADTNRTLNFHTAPVIALAINNNQLASGSMNGEIFMWNETSWEPKHRKTVSGEINALKFVDSFSLVSISSDKGLSLWDTESGVEKFSYKNILFGVMTSLLINEKRQLIISTDRGYILIFDRFGEKINEFTVSGPVISLHGTSQDLLTNLNTSIRYFDNPDYSLKRIVNIKTGMETLRVTEPTRGIGETIVYSLKASLLILDSNGNLIKSITSRDSMTFTNLSQIDTGLLVAASSQEIYFFNLATSLEVNSIRNIKEEIISIIADRNNVIIGTKNNLIKFYENTHVENDADLPEPEIPKLKQIVIGAHSSTVSSLDVSSNGLIASGSLDNTVAFINSSTAIIVNKSQFTESIVYVKFENSIRALIVTAKGNLTLLDIDNFSIFKSASISEDVTSALLFDENILVGTKTGFIRVYDKNDLTKKQDIEASSKPIDVLANLEIQTFGSSSENELRIWTSDFTALKEPIDTTSKIVDIFRLSNRNLLTIGQDGLIVIWLDPNFERRSTSKLSGANVFVTSAATANNGNIFLATRSSLVEYDLINAIEISIESIGASKILIDGFQRPIIGTENGSIIVQVFENFTIITESIKQEFTSVKSTLSLTSLIQSSPPITSTDATTTFVDNPTKQETKSIESSLAQTTFVQSTISTEITYSTLLSQTFKDTNKFPITSTESKTTDQTILTQALTQSVAAKTSISQYENTTLADGLQNTSLSNLNSVLTTT